MQLQAFLVRATFAFKQELKSPKSLETGNIYKQCCVSLSHTADQQPHIMNSSAVTHFQSRNAAQEERYRQLVLLFEATLWTFSYLKVQLCNVEDDALQFRRAHPAGLEEYYLTLVICSMTYWQSTPVCAGQNE